MTFLISFACVLLHPVLLQNVHVNVNLHVLTQVCMQRAGYTCSSWFVCVCVTT